MIKIIEIKKRIGLGVTNPYRVSCSDNKIYAVKFPGNPEGTKALINEFVCSELCKKLELPILNYSLIKVDLSSYTEEMKNDLDLIEGTAFGTEYNDNAIPVISARMIINSFNRYDALKILIFDLLISNFDRNEGNFLIDSKLNKLIMIDHSHVFNIGPLWNEYQLPRLIDEEFEIQKLNQFNYNMIMESLKIDNKLKEEITNYVRKIKEITEEEIRKILNKIPNDWEMTENEKKLLERYIIVRFKKIDDLIKKLNLKVGDENGK